jgi:Ca2+-binding RTX toxin-like protein
MATVTVPGTGGSTIAETFDNQANFALAQQIANALAAAQNAGSLTVTTATGGGLVPPPAGPGTNELIIQGGGDYTVPSGAGGTGYIVVLDTTDPVMIHGTPNMSVWGGAGPLTIIDPAAIAIGEGAGDAVATISGTGDVLAGNNQNDTLTAYGVAESIAGGTGSNMLLAFGANDTISAQGKADTLVAGSGGSTFLIAPTATGESVVGGSGGLTVTDAGTGDTVIGGAGALAVTTSGASARIVGSFGALTDLDTGTSDTITAGTGATSVTLAGSSGFVVGGLGFLSVTDQGTSDTIAAGAGFASITASTASTFVQGGAGQFNFVGGSGQATIVGSSGDATIFGGTGLTSITGGSGGAMTYVNTTGGGLIYSAGAGNETIDASLSKGFNTIFGGTDTAGHNLLEGGVGGANIVGGAGTDTLVGNGGVNTFFFFPSSGGPSANHVIADFSSIDNALLLGYGSGAASAAIATAQVAGNSTTVTLSDNTRITFTGITDPNALAGHFFSS